MLRRSSCDFVVTEEQLLRCFTEEQCSLLLQRTSCYAVDAEEQLLHCCYGVAVVTLLFWRGSVRYRYGGAAVTLLLQRSSCYAVDVEEQLLLLLRRSSGSLLLRMGRCYPMPNGIAARMAPG